VTAENHVDPDQGTSSAPPEGEITTSEVISEEALDEEVLEETAGPNFEPVPTALLELEAKLKRHGFSPSLHAESRVPFLNFDLQAGRSTRPIMVAAEAADILLSADLRNWRSLQRYDGLWSSAEGIVEVALQSERFIPTREILWRLNRNISRRFSDRTGLPPEYITVDERSRIQLRIGEASDLASVVLRATPTARRQEITLRVTGVALTTTDEADQIVEQIADSLAIDLDHSLPRKRLIGSGVTTNSSRKSADESTIFAVGSCIRRMVACGTRVRAFCQERNMMT